MVNLTVAVRVLIWKIGPCRLLKVEGWPSDRFVMFEMFVLYLFFSCALILLCSYDSDGRQRCRQSHTP